MTMWDDEEIMISTWSAWPPSLALQSLAASLMWGPDVNQKVFTKMQNPKQEKKLETRIQDERYNRIQDTS